MANRNKDAELVDEKQALSLFFSSLLTDTDELAVSEQNEVENLESRDFKEKRDDNNTAFLPVIPISVTEASESKPEVTEIAEENNDIIEEHSDELKTTHIKSTVIDGTFQIMMFKTVGLTLAVPLVELSGVISWPDVITEMPGHKESYLGIVQHLDKKIPIIDIAQIVFPQDRIASIVAQDSKERLKRIVFINDFEWGLACDAVNDVITIESEQIKWRKSETKRAWLAGTVVEHMCALLDIKELSKLLNSAHS